MRVQQSFDANRDFANEVTVLLIVKLLASFIYIPDTVLQYLKIIQLLVCMITFDCVIKGVISVCTRTLPNMTAKRKDLDAV
jgi:hypothetical protein